MARRYIVSCLREGIHPVGILYIANSQNGRDLFQQRLAQILDGASVQDISIPRGGAIDC